MDQGALRLDFNRRLMLQFRGSAITSDSGLLAYRELDDIPGLTDTAADTLADARSGKNGRHRLAGLLRQSVFRRLAGYEDVNDAERLCRDPAMRWVVGDRAITGSAASASQMGRFEPNWLSRASNLAALADLSGQRIDKVHQRRSPKRIVLDMDSSESPTSASTKAAPSTGILAARAIARYLCSTNSAMSSAARYGLVTYTAPPAGARWSEPIVTRYRGTVKRLYFRGDAAFANPEMHEFLEANQIGYTIRLPANDVLQRRICYLLHAPGRTTPARSAPLLLQLQLPGADLEQAASCRGQGRVASGRAVPARRLHRDQLGAVGRVRRRLLQPARHSRAASKEGKARSNGRACHAAPSQPMPFALAPCAGL